MGIEGAEFLPKGNHPKISQAISLKAELEAARALSRRTLLTICELIVVERARLAILHVEASKPQPLSILQENMTKEAVKIRNASSTLWHVIELLKEADRSLSNV